MALTVDINKRLPDFDLKISFTCEDGELTVLIGPSGAGKTTIIRIIAGLSNADEGFISYKDKVWVDTNRGIFLPTQQRRLGLVFQDYTLFPHLNVYKNVAFAAVDEREVEGLLKLFKIWHLKDSMPHKISGGERQRCAICQNLARHPQVLLLDEPFSALDVEIRRKLREGLKSIKKDLNIPILHVTHDLSEALFLEDAILPIVEGKFAEQWLQKHAEAFLDDEIRTNKTALKFIEKYTE